MKFIVSSTALFSHLQAISRVINSKNSLPILDCFLMELQDGTLSMTLYTLTEGAEQPTDYAAIDMDLYVAGTDTAEYLPDESVQIYVASDGTLTAATAADIAVGDMLAFYKTEDGGNAIAIYHPAAAE